MKNLFLILAITVFTIGSCSKNEEPIVVANPATQTCFLDSYNGTYTGVDGNIPLEPNVVVKLTKTGCETCTLESSLLGNKSVASLLASSNGAYVGKLADGSAVQIALTGTQISIQCTGYTFNGSK